MIEIDHWLNFLKNRYFTIILALLYLLSSQSEKELSLKELLFLIQVAPELASDQLIPYLWKNEGGDQSKLRTYLMARFLTPELFNYGPSVSVAIALLRE